MVRLNFNYEQLRAGYLFPEIAKRTKAFAAAHPGVKVMRLGIGNTTEPLTPTVVAALTKAACSQGILAQGNQLGYSGYGDEQGNPGLREDIAKWYASLGATIEPDEVFVSDGAKPDTANIQSIFPPDITVALQDPVYPVYLDTNVIAGRAGEFDEATGMYGSIVYMPCTPANKFFPRLPLTADLIYFCSPNNPTGSVATKPQLEELVNRTKSIGAVLIFDGAYQAYIRDPAVPRSIYQVEGAQKHAIEINSFSKWAGFTGLRLGWTVVPKAIAEGKANALWNRRQCTFFNGASNVVQEAGRAALSPQGLVESQELVDYYMANAAVIRQGVESVGMTAFGGENAPYIWVKTPGGMKSWDFFDRLLNEAHVVCTPGAGFGPSGEGFFRLSAFGHKENIAEAVASIKTNLKVD